jgi:hypothetical protein
MTPTRQSRDKAERRLVADQAGFAAATTVSEDR